MTHAIGRLVEAGIVTIDPARSFGAPIFVRGGARVEDVISRLDADERIRDVAAEFGVPVEDIIEYIAAHLVERLRDAVGIDDDH